jgi:glycosyltransferase involved in cell wall biosynthesis
MKPRLVFLSSIKVPHQVKLCDALQPWFDAQFWFYEGPERTRGDFWNISDTRTSRVLEDTWRLNSRYMRLDLHKRLADFNPDIVMLGGFSIPANYLAYRWATANNKKTVVFTERSRSRRGKLRSRGVAWRVLRRLYRHVDLVIVSADDAVEQFRDTLDFGNRVVAGRYAADIDAYFSHPIRRAQAAYTLLYPNRMTEIYDPLLAIDIFDDFRHRHPGSRLLMNAAGELGPRCRSRIGELGLREAVEFLTNVRRWDDLHRQYARADIMLLPARFSNGNFTILESMASGMGIVISDRILGIGKLIEDEVNGFRVPHDRRLFVESLERYTASPKLFEKHASLNRQKVAPLGVSGTAEFTANLLQDRLGFAPQADNGYPTRAECVRAA